MNNYVDNFHDYWVFVRRVEHDYWRGESILRTVFGTFFWLGLKKCRNRSSGTILSDMRRYKKWLP
ncbi:hypothetical protein HMPREF3193_00465 [Bifidobacterium breve]|nr:hypothetical protein HMPREF1587_01708 [Bifidobacterium breve JCP7499]KWZ86285.1 hypothetical protein HMPREF3193_00465 [Bifidobacterium breve]